MREACKREGFADFENLTAMNLVSQQRISGRIRSRTIGRREGLAVARLINTDHTTEAWCVSVTHLGGNVVVEVPGVFRAT